LGGFQCQNFECWVPQAPRPRPESNLLCSLAQKRPVQTKSVRNGPCAFWTRKGVFCLSILVARCNPCFRSDGCRLAWPRRAGHPAPRGPDALVLAARPCGEPALVSAGCTCCPAQGPFSARCVRPRGVCARRCWSAAGRPRSRAPRTRSHLAIAMRARRRMARPARPTEGPPIRAPQRASPSSRFHKSIAQTPGSPSVRLLCASVPACGLSQRHGFWSPSSHACRRPTIHARASTMIRPHVGVARRVKSHAAMSACARQPIPSRRFHTKMPGFSAPQAARFPA
jgi:hypothetical protein